MKGLTILASPHTDGNNAKILNTIVDSIEQEIPNIEFENLTVNNLNLRPCTACKACERKKGCIIDDDMNNLYSKFDQANLILIASPLYFNTVSAQLKMIIDRCQALWSSKYVLKDSLIDRKKKRIGLFISTAGQPLTEDRFKYVTGTIDLFFRAINTEYYDNFFVGNVDQEDIEDRPEILTRAKKLGRKLSIKL